MVGACGSSGERWNGGTQHGQPGSQAGCGLCGRAISKCGVGAGWSRWIHPAGEIQNAADRGECIESLPCAERQRRASASRRGREYQHAHGSSARGRRSAGFCRLRFAHTGKRYRRSRRIESQGSGRGLYLRYPEITSGTAAGSFRFRSRTLENVQGGGRDWDDQYCESQEQRHSVGALDDTQGQQIAVTMNPAHADKLLADSGHTFAELLALVDAGKPVPVFPLMIRLKAKTSVERSEVESQNVAGILRGADPARRNEYVVLSAHLDHLGVGEPINGDKI